MDNQAGIRLYIGDTEPDSDSAGFLLEHGKVEAFSANGLPVGAKVWGKAADSGARAVVIAY